MPEISIIVPVFNTGKYLSNCLDSILGQTFSGFEVICVDDGSTDESADILAKYAKNNNRVKIITQNNAGLSEARNNGLEAASGKYVLFVDSDDSIHTRTLEITHALAERHTADVVSFSYVRIDHLYKDISQIDNSKDTPYKLTNKPLFFCNKKGKWSISFTAWGKLFRSSIIKNRKFIPGIYFEDYPYIVCLLKSQPTTIILQTKLYNYTYNPSSITQTNVTPRKIQDYHIGLNYIYNECFGSKEFKFILRNIFPNILKQQFNLILRSEERGKKVLWESFQNELVDLNRKKCIRLIGNKLRCYIMYRKLIKNAK